MTLLDRSIARQYLTNALVLLAALCSFVVAIDLSLNADDYVEIARRLVRERGGDPAWFRTFPLAAYLAFDLWWPQLLQLFNYALGFILAGALGFTCAQMVKGRELVAILASGISLFRVMRPILLVASLFVGVAVLNQELVLPRIAPLLTRSHQEAGRHDVSAVRVPLSADGRGNLWYVREFDAERATLAGVHVWERDADGRALRRITADAGAWDPARGGWVLTGGVAESRRDRGVPSQAVDFVATDLDPTAMTVRRYAAFARSLSWRQIGRMLEAPERLDASTRQRLEDLERIRWGRVSVVVCNLLVLVVTFPFFLRREPGNMIVQSLRAAPVAMVSIVGAVFGSAVALPGVPPQISVFLPAMVLLPLAIASASSVRT